jgi:hypothetical protein
MIDAAKGLERMATILVLHCFGRLKSQVGNTPELSLLRAMKADKISWVGVIPPVTPG